MRKRTLFGWHLVIDLVDCEESIDCSTRIADYAKQLCKVIDMKPFGEPTVVHFGHQSPITSGYSLVQLIETSNITGHFSDHYRSAHIDIFSCKPYNWRKALDFTKEWFEGEVGKVRFFRRFC